MPFVDGLYSFLSGTAGITALTGSGSSARIYPLIAPELLANASLSTTLVYAQVSRQDIELLRETAKRKTEFEFIALAETHSAAHALADALESALDRYRGAMGAYTCDFARLLDISDDVIPDTGTYVVTSRYLLTHTS